MPNKIKATLPQIEIASKDMQIVVQSGGSKLGTLLISRGSIEWRPANNSVKLKRLGWRSFAALMEAKGKDIKKATVAKKKAATRRKRRAKAEDQPAS